MKRRGLRKQQIIAVFMSLFFVIMNNFSVFAVVADEMERSSTEEEVTIEEDGTEEIPLEEKDNIQESKEESAEVPTDAVEREDAQEQPMLPILPMLPMVPNLPGLKEEAPHDRVEGQWKAPDFHAEFRIDFEGRGIVGYLSEMNECMTEIIPCYSLDGETYFSSEFGKWLIDVDHLEDPNVLRQQCFWAVDEPIRSYQAGEIDGFYVNLQITYCDGTVVNTESVLFERGTPTPLPDHFKLSGMYGRAVRQMQFDPPAYDVWGEYHLTVPTDISSEELQGLLPGQVPVEINAYESSSRNYVAEVDYNVIWPQDISFFIADTLEIAAEGIVPPAECEFKGEEDIYFVNHSRLEAMQYDHSDFRAVLHFVSPETQSELLLSAGENGLAESGIGGTLPLKPTGAESIVSEYSVDGGENWISLHDVAKSNPVESYLPKEASYTATIVKGDDKPVQEYMTGLIDGFSLRLRIEGSVFSQVTEVQNWPPNYEYFPPTDDTDDEGSGGNENNAGSSGSSSNGGMHPSVPEEDKPPVVTLPSVGSGSSAEGEGLFSEELPKETSEDMTPFVPTFLGEVPLSEKDETQGFTHQAPRSEDVIEEKAGHATPEEKQGQTENNGDDPFLSATAALDNEESFPVNEPGQVKKEGLPKPVMAVVLTLGVAAVAVGGGRRLRSGFQRLFKK